MSKKLIQRYTFNPSTSTVVIDDIVDESRFLLITNVSQNVLIYVFNEPTLGYQSVSHNWQTQQTTVVLSYDCSAMSSSDKLQIFVEQDAQVFEPSDTFTDPVSKMRVSTPQNLIDTDFEYGLQSTKWETLELINNIPTFFAREGIQSLALLSMQVTSGSDNVNVVTSEDHGLIVGNPIIVKGAGLSITEGTFVVTNVINSKQFIFKSKKTSNITTDVLDTYTEILPASLYQGTEFKLESLGAITTDGGVPSTVTVSTKSPHGFSQGTTFYLLNSLTSNSITFNGSSVIPKLDVDKQSIIDLSAPTTQNKVTYFYGEGCQDPGIVGLSTVYSGIDDGAQLYSIDLDPAFKFFGKSYDKVWVSSQSKLIFSNTTPSGTGVLTTGYDENTAYPAIWLYPNLNYQILKVYKEVVTYYSTRIRIEAVEYDAGNTSSTPATLVYEIYLDGSTDEALVKVFKREVSDPVTDLPIVVRDWNPSLAAVDQERWVFRKIFDPSFVLGPANELYFMTSGGAETTNNLLDYHNTSKFCPYVWTAERTSYRPSSTLDRSGTTFFALGKDADDENKSFGIIDSIYVKSTLNNVITFSSAHNLIDNRPYLYIPGISNTGLTIAGTAVTVPTVYYVKTVAATYGGTATITDPETQCVLVAQAARTVALTVNFSVPTAVVRFPLSVDRFGPHCFMAVSRTHSYSTTAGDSFIAAPDSQSGAIIENQPIAFFASAPTGTTVSTNNYIPTSSVVYYARNINAATHAVADWTTTANNGTVAAAALNAATITLTIAQTSLNNSALFVAGTSNSNIGHFVTFKGTNDLVTRNITGIVTAHSGTTTRTFTIKVTDNLDVALLIQSGNVGANFSSSTTGFGLTFNVAAAPDGVPINLSAAVYDGYFAPLVYPWAPTKSYYDKNHTYSTNDILYHYTGAAAASASAIPGGLTNNSYYRAETVDQNRFRLLNDQTGVTFNYSSVTGSQLSRSFANRRSPKGMIKDASVTILSTPALQNTLKEQSKSSDTTDSVINFTGTGGITLQSSSDFAFGTGNFQIDMWVRRTTVGSSQTLLDFRTSATSDVGLNLTLNSADLVWDYGAANNRTVTNIVPINTWTAITVGRSSGVFKLWVNGVEVDTVTPSSQNYGTHRIPKIAKNYAGTNYFTGQMYGIRMTRSWVNDAAKIAAYYRAGNEEYTVLYITGENKEVRDDNSLFNRTQGPNEGQRKYKRDYASWLWRSGGAAAGGTSLSLTYPMPGYSSTSVAQIPTTGNLTAGLDNFTITIASGFIGQSNFGIGHKVKLFDGTTFMPLVLSDGTAFNDLDIRVGAISGTRPAVTITAYVMTPGGLPGTFTRVTNGRMILDTGIPVRDEDHVQAGSSWTKPYWDIIDSNCTFPNVGAAMIDVREDSSIAYSQLSNSVVTAVSVADPVTVTLSFPSTSIPISSVTRTTNVARIVTSRPHGLKDGQTVAIASITDGTFNNASAQVLSTTIDTFTYANAGTDGASSVSGTVSPAINSRTTNILTISNITRANPAVVTTTASHGYTNGQPFVFQGMLVGDWAGLWDNTTIYYARVTAATTFEVYKGSGLQVTLDTSAYATSYVQGTNAGRIFGYGSPVEFTSQRLTFDNRTADLNGDTFNITNHNLNAGTALIYANGGGTSIGGLDAGSTKYVFDPKPNTFRLSDTQAGWSSAQIPFTQSTGIVAATGVFTTPTHGFTTGKQVQFLSPNPPIGLTNGHFYYVRVSSATAFTLYWTKNGAINAVQLDQVKIVGTIPAVVATVQQAEVVDLTSVGVGSTQSFTTPVQTGAVDGLYTIADAAPAGDTSSFTLSNTLGTTITKRVIGIEPTRAVNLLNKSFYLQDHKLITGTAVLYNTTGNPIGSLVDGTVYYVIANSPDNFSLAATVQDAESGLVISLNQGTFYGTGSHQLTIDSIVGANTGAGFITTTYQSKLVTGNSTNFTASFKKGDRFGWNFPASIYNKAVTFAGSPSTFSSATHNMGNKHQVKWYSTVSPPDGFYNGTIYYVRRTAAGTFTLHPTPTDVDNNTNGITALNGSGTHYVQFINEGNSGVGEIETVLSKYKLRLTDATSVSYAGLYKVEVFSVVKTNGSANLVITTPGPHPYVVGGLVYITGTGDATIDGTALAISAATVNTITATLSTNASATVTYQVDNSIKCYGNVTQANTTFSASASSGTNTFTVASALGIAPGAKVSGTGIPTNAYVYDINGTTITLDVPHTGVTSGNPVTFDYGLYTVPSSLLLRADSSSVHRPYDGGVEIVTSSNPQSAMIRQTRKYFRYQSGKGIQVSFAVNFSPTVPVDSIQRIDGTYLEVSTRNPHKLTAGLYLTLNDITVNGLGVNNLYNGIKQVSQIVDDYTFRLTSASPAEHPPASTAGGLGEYAVNQWSGSVMRCGLFDDQNGMFFEFDGNTLYVVRRNSTTQITGKSSVVFNSNTINGSGTNYSTDLTAGDYIVIRGQTYKVVAIDNSAQMHIQPAYRGLSKDNIVISKIQELRIPQSAWNRDKMDGTGPSGYKLDKNRIQMAYMDYSWYGAGKVRFGFKARDGVVRYVHEIVHGNIEREAYLRSGNLPARYEVRTLENPTYVPKLAHWGTSVIMDGQFSDDKAYQFSANSNSIKTNSPTSVAITASGIVRQIQKYSAYNNQGVLIGDIGYAIEVSYLDTLRFVGAGTAITGPSVSLGTVLATANSAAVKTQVGSTPFLLNVRTSPFNFNRVNLLVINIAPTTVTGSFQNYAITQATDLSKEIPLLSIRLAPSVDNGVPGSLGAREIINRMQLALSTLDVLSTHEAELSLVLNADLDNLTWSRVTAPSLSQVVYHSVSDTIENGLPIFSFRVPPGPQLTTTQRGQALTSVSLDAISTLGNAIMGGDGVFPDGPDILTLKMRYLGLTTDVTTNAVFNFSSRLSWNESQA